ncbi:MAG: arginine--tRNA ligase [Phycisphaerae bacterium]|nr:arginine--tRNA ligase [Phycisphaerae bacterium]
MPSIIEQLADGFRKALAEVSGSQDAYQPKWLTPTADPKFGDYQFNGAMALAKELKAKPRDVAAKIADALALPDLIETPEIAGPGFINIKLKDPFLTDGITAVLGDERLGVEPARSPQTVVVDFSAPNLAKEMHVGHLRSTIIGDCIARILEFDGHDVRRINHVGDFGGLGLLIQYVRETQPNVAQSPDAFHVSDLEEFYRQARQCEQEEPRFAEAARQAIVDLQTGESLAVALWKAFRAESLRHCQEIYDRLSIRLETVGESDYLREIPEVIESLQAKGMLAEDKGALCLFLDGFKNRDGEPLPMIVRKSDGGYLYDTTDLAALRRRTRRMNAQRIVYVTDSRQRQHFEMLFAAGRKAGWAGESVRLDHVGFGMMLGSDRRPFKTRTGGTTKLADLLNEAEARALALIRQRGETYSELAESKRQAQTPEQQADIARAVGLGSVRYADLCQDHTSDYVFSWDKMLSFDGNTAPYMMYAYARIRSVFDRAGADPDAVVAQSPPVRITHAAERTLILELLRFPELIAAITDTWRIHELPTYLFTLANTFMGLYQDRANWPIVDAQPDVRESRLALCAVTARTLKLGLGLLGIEAVREM